MYQHKNKIYINDFTKELNIKKHNIIFIIEDNYKLLCKYLLRVINTQVINDRLILYLPNISDECYIFIFFLILHSYEVSLLKTLFNKKDNSQYLICTKVNNAAFSDLTTLIKNIENINCPYFIFENYLPNLHITNIITGLNTVWKSSYFNSIL